jgi:argininosuccinate lyase
MSNLWSGRFATDPDADVFEFGRSFPFDRALFEDDVTGSIAWAEALGSAGVIERLDAEAIVRTLEAIRSEGVRDPTFVSGPDEDVHAFVERQLVERLGATGKRLHTGRSRNEQVSLDLRLYVKRRIAYLQSGLVSLVGVLAEQASQAGDALMPAYTHLRRAQPILVAHFFLAHAAAFRRDHAGLAFAASVADELPLGSGAVAGTSYAVDTKALAARLGFSRIVSNSIDASSDRDFVAVFLHACALSMAHLSRLAEDLVLFSAEEFEFFEIADAVSTGSSLMPQKKNPDPLELIRGKVGRSIGHVTGWLATLKGLPSGYNKDLQEDKEAVFDADRTLAGSLTTARRVIEGLVVNAERTREAASGLLLATDVAEYLVARGLPFREAHEVVGGLVRRLAAAGRGFESLSAEEWEAVHPRVGSEVQRVISPERAVAARKTPQSTAPAHVREALGETSRWVAANQPG